MRKRVTKEQPASFDLAEDHYRKTWTAWDNCRRRLAHFGKPHVTPADGAVERERADMAATAERCRQAQAELERIEKETGLESWHLQENQRREAEFHAEQS